jgi:hypothetical protein
VHSHASFSYLSVRACAAAGLPSTAAPQLASPNEWLFVKTDRNYGGEDERQLTRRESRLLGMDAPPHPMIPDAAGYEILQRKDIPPAVWEDDRLVVERFISHRRNLFFRAYVLLQAVVVEAGTSDALIKKMHNGLFRKLFFAQGSEMLPASTQQSSLRLSSLPTGLLQAISKLCRELRLDFGTLDVVMNDARECFIIDVNTTPYWGRSNMG